MTAKPCLHPRANHQHGTYLAFVKDGCRCAPCTTAHRAECKRIAHRTVTGTHTYVDAQPARDHVRMLIEQGLTIGQIEQRSGVHRTAIRVLIGDWPGRPASKRITRHTQAALLAVRPNPVGTEQHGLVDPTGARRRLQALMALGWNGRYLAERLSMSSRTFWTLVREQSTSPVLVSTRTNVIDLYDELCLTVPAPSRARTRALTIARESRWQPPLAWDDDVIDMPAAATPEIPLNSVHVDDIAIERRMAGDKSIRLNKDETVELARRWRSSGRPLNEMQRVTGINAHRYLKRGAAA